MKIVPFLSDSHEDGFIIFRIEDENEPDAYVWVSDGEVGSSSGIRVTSFYALASYLNHVTEPFIVCSKVKPETIAKAFERMEKCPKEDMDRMFEDYNNEMEWRRKDEKKWKEYKDWEDFAIENIKKAEEEGNGEVVF